MISNWNNLYREERYDLIRIDIVVRVDTVVRVDIVVRVEIVVRIEIVVSLVRMTMEANRIG